MKRIITVGREFGSGGREFGRRLSEELYWENTKAMTCVRKQN